MNKEYCEYCENDIEYVYIRESPITFPEKTCVKCLINKENGRVIKKLKKVTSVFIEDDGTEQPVYEILKYK